MSLATIEPLSVALTQRGGDPDLLAKELLGQIGDAIDAHPRSLQTEIGPSEVGQPCARRLGYKLTGHETVNHRAEPSWKPTVGTAVHSWLAEALIEANRPHDHLRWLVELEVEVGDGISGHLDLYDRVTATVVDWKVVGPSQLRAYRATGPGQQYRAQVHLYGRGATRRGLPVDTVMIAFLPRNGELAEAFFWHEPYDESVATAALRRLQAISLVARSAGVAPLPTADAFCTRCPYFLPGSIDPQAGCPGHPHAAEQPQLTFNQKGKS